MYSCTGLNTQNGCYVFYIKHVKGMGCVENRREPQGLILTRIIKLLKHFFIKHWFVFLTKIKVSSQNIFSRSYDDPK